MEVLTIVQAIQEAANTIVSGESKFAQTPKNIKIIRDMLYPDMAEETEEKAKKSQELLEKEFSKGPISVQPLDYVSSKKKRR